MTADPALVVGVGVAVSGSTSGTTWTVVVVDGGVVAVGCGWHAISGPMQLFGGMTGRAGGGVVGELQLNPLSLLLDEPVTPSEPFQAVLTVTAPVGRGAEKGNVDPVQVSGVVVPLMVTVAELVPVDGNAE